MNVEKHFGTRNLYNILQIAPSSTIQDVKKSYYKLALLYHPDRVSTEERENAKEKFNIIHNAYRILSDVEKKKLYDDGSNVLFTKATISAKWENYLKPVTSMDIDNARGKYQGSLEEKNDLIRECDLGKGSMTHLLNNIPFMRVEDECRIMEILKNLMDHGELRQMKIKRIRK